MSLKLSKKDLLRWLPGSLVWVSGPRTRQNGYLTFDDGPHPEHTPRLLDLLAEHGVKATFFLVGSAVEQHPAVVERIVREGHALGNHSWSHPRFGELPVAAQLEEIDRCDAMLARFDGLQRHAFRPPRGELSLALMWHMWRQGRRIVYWTHDSMDYRKGPARELARALGSKPLVAGDIVLMHDDDDCARDMLGELLPVWQSRGMRFGALPVAAGRS